MRNLTRPLIAVLALALAAPLAAAAQTEEPVSPGTYTRNKIEATGKLSRTEGCQILTDKDGKKYTLIGDLSAFRDGEKIFVRGTIGETSPCTDSPAIQVVDASAQNGQTSAAAGHDHHGHAVAPAAVTPVTNQEKPAMQNTVVQGKAIPKAGKKVVVRGVLTDEGVECQALRGDDGILYTLTGDLEGFEVGDHVRVQGTVAEVSICQQGTTLDVKKIQKDPKKE